MNLEHELRSAAATLDLLVNRASGTDWTLALTDGGPEDGPGITGVMNEKQDLVMGDCMADVNNEVSDVDARYVAMMDPGFGALVVGLLLGAAEDAAFQWEVPRTFLHLARRINDKYPPEGQDA